MPAGWACIAAHASALMHAWPAVASPVASHLCTEPDHTYIRYFYVRALSCHPAAHLHPGAAERGVLQGPLCWPLIRSTREARPSEKRPITI